MPDLVLNNPQFVGFKEASVGTTEGKTPLPPPPVPRKHHGQPPHAEIKFQASAGP